MSREYSWRVQYVNSFNNNLLFEKFENEENARSFANMVNGKVFYYDIPLNRKAV